MDPKATRVSAGQLDQPEILAIVESLGNRVNLECVVTPDPGVTRASEGRSARLAQKAIPEN